MQSVYWNNNYMSYQVHPVVSLWKKIGLLGIYAGSRIRSKSDAGPLVITYHRISDVPCPFDPLVVSSETFEKQIVFLRKHYRILSGLELVYLIQSRDRVPPQSCVITFDDGWRDNYTHAFPILRRYTVPALIFLATDFIDTNKIFWYERLKGLIHCIAENFDQEDRSGYLKGWPQDLAIKMKKLFVSELTKRLYLVQDFIIHLKSYPPDRINDLIHMLEENLGSMGLEYTRTMLSWDEVQEMAGENIIFGSHTKTHALLTTISESETVTELTDSKNVIEEKLSEQVYFLSYPNGFYNAKIASLAKELGYLAAFTCNSGENYPGINPFEFRRKHLREDRSMGLNGQFSELFFKISLSDVGDLIQRWRKIEAY